LARNHRRRSFRAYVEQHRALWGCAREQVTTLEAPLARQQKEFAEKIRRLQTIPGVGAIVASTAQEVTSIWRADFSHPDLCIRAPAKQAIRRDQFVVIDLVVPRLDINEDELALTPRLDVGANVAFVDFLIAPRELRHAVAWSQMSHPFLQILRASPTHPTLQAKCVDRDKPERLLGGGSTHHRALP
jgi:hypothetical protein